MSHHLCILLEQHALQPSDVLRALGEGAECTASQCYTTDSAPWAMPAARISDSPASSWWWFTALCVLALARLARPSRTDGK